MDEDEMSGPHADVSDLGILVAIVATGYTIWTLASIVQMVVFGWEANSDVFSRKNQIVLLGCICATVGAGYLVKIDPRGRIPVLLGLSLTVLGGFQLGIPLLAYALWVTAPSSGDEQ